MKIAAVAAAVSLVLLLVGSVASRPSLEPCPPEIEDTIEFAYFAEWSHRQWLGYYGRANPPGEDTFVEEEIGHPPDRANPNFRRDLEAFYVREYDRIQKALAEWCQPADKWPKRWIPGWRSEYPARSSVERMGDE